MGKIPIWFLKEWGNTAFRVGGIYSARFKRGFRDRGSARDSWVFIAVTEGVLRLRQGAWTADLLPGDQTILLPDHPLTREVLSPECHWAIIEFRLEATGLGMDPLPMLGFPAVVHIPLSPEWMWMYRQGLDAMGAEVGLVSGVLLGRWVADAIVGQYLHKGITGGGIAMTKQVDVPPWLTMIRERIENEFNVHDIDPARMALEAGFSRTHFYRVFKRTFATTPMNLLWERRLQIAARKLDTDPFVPIGKVAYDCGFKNHTHFTRMFRRRFGVAPKQWRRRHLGQ
ncbi:helix-turn-helix transcriptional regulator [Verrucomicrobiota bacterium]